MRWYILLNSIMDLSTIAFQHSKLPGSPACSLTTSLCAYFLNSSSLSNSFLLSLYYCINSATDGMAPIMSGLNRLMYAMSMPNCVPQSPMWFARVTCYPFNSRMRLIQSPMMVDLRCPTCISFAMLGEL